MLHIKHHHKAFFLQPCWNKWCYYYNNFIGLYLFGNEKDLWLLEPSTQADFTAFCSCSDLMELLELLNTPFPSRGGHAGQKEQLGGTGHLHAALQRTEHWFHCLNCRDFVSTISLADLQVCFWTKTGLNECMQAGTRCTCWCFLCWDVGWKESKYQTREIRTDYVSIYWDRLMYMCVHAFSQALMINFKKARQTTVKYGGFTADFKN